MKDQLKDNDTMNGNIDFFLRFVGLTPGQGAQTTAYLATSPDVDNATAQYWEKGDVMPSGRAAYDEVTWTRLWEVSDRIVATNSAAVWGQHRAQYRQHSMEETV